jgi:hypothetical protein
MHVQELQQQRHVVGHLSHPGVVTWRDAAYEFERLPELAPEGCMDDEHVPSVGAPVDGHVRLPSIR